MNLKEKLLQKKNLWHLGAVSLFLLVSVIYFYPTVKGYAVKQPDVQKWLGASQEVADYRAIEGQVGWTNAMFSGMPATQISMTYKGTEIPTMLRNAYSLWLPRPIAFLFVYFLSFYIMALSFKVKPYVAIIGALAFGLSSSHIIIIDAGHMTKSLAIGYVPLVIAGFNYAYKWKNWILGASLSCLFLSFELQSNHLQITYYMAFILIALGIGELIKTFTDPKRKPIQFVKSTVGLILAYGIAVMINIGNLTGTNEYAQFTTRGGTDLTISATGETNEGIKTSGLDREYITAWSYGKSETFTFLIPNFKGGETMRISDNPANKEVIKGVNQQFKPDVIAQNQYWGDQPFTSGPVYLGVTVVFLSILALVYSDDKSKWALLAVTIITVMLSWGKNLMGFTDFFLDYLPGYNKFRAVTIILAVAQLCVPLLGVLFLQKLIDAKETIAKKTTGFYVVSGVLGGLILLFAASPGTFNNFLSDGETDQLNQLISNPAATAPAIEFYNNLFNEIESTRIAIFRSDVLRSFGFLIVLIILIFVFIKSAVNKYLFSGILALIVLLDLGLIAKRYLNNEKQGKNYVQWTESWKQENPYLAGNGDLEIYNLEVAMNPQIQESVAIELQENKSNFSKETSSGEKSRIEDRLKFRVLNRMTNYRVFDLANPFNSSYASYFHKSIGGYHGAKLGRYQELIEFQIGNQNPSVLDMLNMKYQIASQSDQNGNSSSQFVGINSTAMGNCWFAKNIQSVNSADEEILALTASSGYKLVPGQTFPVLVNGKLISGETIVGPGDRIDFINMIIQDSLILQDTMNIAVPFQSIQTEELAFIPEPQKGTLTWAYNQMLDSSFMKIVVVSKSGRVGWNPNETTIVGKDFIGQVSENTYSGEGNIQMTSYHPDKLTYTSNSTSKQLAVFSEVYYPLGWKAYVDGNETPISRVNYLLRAVELPAGEHEIILEYKLESYELSTTISWIGSILMLAALGFGFFQQKKIKPETPLETAQ